MGLCNLNLMPLKVMLFSYYGGLGCVLPFLTVHMRSLGLTLEETAFVTMILPFITLLGPFIAGVLADKLACYKTVLVLCILLSSLTHTCLLFVPTVEKNAPRPPALEFQCSASGAALVTERCADTCKVDTGGHMMAFQVNNCSYVCPSPSNITHPPHMCLRGQVHDNTECYVMAGNDNGVMRLESALPRYVQQEGKCLYPLVYFHNNGLPFTSLECRVDDPKCLVQCLLVEEEPFLGNVTCDRTEGDPNVTFWMYLMIRGLAELLPATIVALLDAIIVSMVSSYGGSYGQEQLWGMAALGTFAPLCGYLMDSHSDIFGYLDFGPPFYAFDILMCITAILVGVLPLKQEVSTNRWWGQLGRALRTFELLLLYLVSLCLGVLYGALETYIYWYLEDLGASKFLLGLTLTAGIIPSLPFMFCSEKIVRFCGSANLFIVALVFYSIRFTGYAFITNPWFSLPFEALEVFTIYVLWVVAVTSTHLNAPKELNATSQALLNILHFGIGRGFGSLAGGYCISIFGFQRTWQGAAAISLGLAIIYFVIYYIFLKIHKYRRRKQFARSARKSQSIFTDYISIQHSSAQLNGMKTGEEKL